MKEQTVQSQGIFQAFYVPDYQYLWQPEQVEQVITNCEVRQK